MKHKFNLATPHIIRYITSRLGISMFLLGLVAGCQTGNSKLQQGADTKDIISSQNKSEYTQRFEVALAELNAKRYEQATKHLLTLKTDFPSQAEPLANLGLISFIRKDLVNAKKYLLETIEKENSISQAYNLLGLIALNEKDVRTAEKHLLKAVELDEKYANAHYNLALLYEIYLQDMKLAASHYQRYLESINNKDELTSDWLSGIEAVIQQSK